MNNEVCKVVYGLYTNISSKAFAQDKQEMLKTA